MRFEHEGRSLWYGTSDAQAPADTIEAGTEVPITIGIQPSDASNIVEVRYRVNQEPAKLVSAKFLWNDPARKAQYFQAKLPAFRAGDTVEYSVVCRCAGRQVPDPDVAGKMKSAFSVAGGKSETKEKDAIKPPPDIKDGMATTFAGKTASTIVSPGKTLTTDKRIGQPLGTKDISAPKAKDAKRSDMTPGITKTPTSKPTGNAGAPIDTVITVKKQKPPEAPNPTLRELVSAVRIDKGQEIVSALSKHGIYTLADIRKAGGLGRLKDPAIPADHPSVKTLEAHANLSILPSDLQMNVKLIDKGYKGIFDIANVPKKTFMHKMGGTLDLHVAGSLYDSNQKIFCYLNNRAMVMKITDINSLSLTTPFKPSDLIPKQRCECKDCDTVVSPRAYLADLLAYTTKYFEIERPFPNAAPGAPGFPDSVTLEDLEAILHQPFVNLPDSCEAVNKKIRQVRICIEALRRYLGQRPLTNQRKEADLQKAEEVYRWTAYTTLLKKIGASYDELRDARIEKDEKKVQELADRLFVEPAHLEKGGLLNDPTLTEEYLESIFGLVDTNRATEVWSENIFFNIYRKQQKRNSEPKLVTWYKASLHRKWKDEDERPDEDKLPIIDPDLISAEHLQIPYETNPAYKLWKERWDWINDHKKGGTIEKGRLSKLKEIGENTYKRTSDNLERLKAVMNEAQMDTAMLEGLERLQEEGVDIASSLKQLGLTTGEFSRLKSLRAVVAGGADLLDSEWNDIYSILVQVEKRKKFQEWKQAEKDSGVFLCPEYFKIPELSSTVFPPKEPDPLPAWRASYNALQDWEDKLQSRIDQDKAITDALGEAVSATEKETLPQLRDALIMASNAPYSNPDTRLMEQAKALDERLFIGTQNGGCQMTTRASQAITTIQSLLWAIRSGLLKKGYPDMRNLTMTATHAEFDETWKWLGSYATWRSAMFIWMYPENILYPTLRNWQTQGFMDLVQNLRMGRRLNPEGAQALADEYAKYYRDITKLEVEATCQCQDESRAHLTYLYGRNPENDACYWSRLDDRNAPYPQSSWKRIPAFSGTNKTLKLLAAVPFGESKILLFAKRKKDFVCELVYVQHNLGDESWEQDEDPEVMGLPQEITQDFEVVVSQTRNIEEQPCVVVKTAKGIWINRLNSSRNGWELNEWRNLLDNPHFIYDERGGKEKDIVLKALIPVYLSSDITCYSLLFFYSQDGSLKFIPIKFGPSSPEPNAVKVTNVYYQGDVLKNPSDWTDSISRVYDANEVSVSMVGVFINKLWESDKSYHSVSSDLVINVSDLARELLRRNTYHYYYEPQSLADFSELIGYYIETLSVEKQLYINQEDIKWKELPTVRVDGEEIDLQGFFYFVTNNRDKMSTSEPYFSGILDYELMFYVDMPVTIFIVHDPRAELPSWLSRSHGWEPAEIKRNTKIETTDVEQPGRNLYVKNFPPGKIELGGNQGYDPSDINKFLSGQKSMYNVIIRPRDASCDIPNRSFTYEKQNVSTPSFGENKKWIGAFSWPKNDFTKDDFIVVFFRNQKKGIQVDRLTLDHFMPSGTTSASAVTPPAPFREDIDAIAIDSGDVGNLSWPRIAKKSHTVWSTQEHHINDLSLTGDYYQLQPIDRKPLQLTHALNSESQFVRRGHTEQLFSINKREEILASTFAYIEEYYYFVPLMLALELQRRGFYQEALDWYRTIYDYSGVSVAVPGGVLPGRGQAEQPVRKIWYGLQYEEAANTQFPDSVNALLQDDKNPHNIASARPNNYTRFTLLSLIRCFLEYGDAEFTQNTPESVPRAKKLYKRALELLDTEELKQGLNECEELIGRIKITIDRAKELVPVEVVDLDEIDDLLDKDPELIAGVTTEIGDFLKSVDYYYENTGRRGPPTGPQPDPIPELIEKIKQLNNGIKEYAKQEKGVRTYGDVLKLRNTQAEGELGMLLANPEVYETIRKIGTPMDKEDTRMVTNAGAGVTRGASGGYSNMGNSPSYGNKYLVSAYGPSGCKRSTSVSYEPVTTAFVYCVPQNPVLHMLRLHAELNLYKTQHCRNIAGMERELEPYAAPTDTVSGLPMIGEGGNLVLPGAVTLRPTLYRYPFLIEKTKQLVQLAGQIEAAMLSSLEKRDNEYYNLKKARQDMGLTRAGVQLQNLRVREAEDGVTLAELQKQRSQIQADYYKELLAEGLSDLEEASIGFMYTALAYHSYASMLHAGGGLLAGLTFGIFGEKEGAAEAASSLASVASTTASILSTYASYERRAQEWRFQKSLAEHDILIGSQQIRLAQDRVRIVGQELRIAGMQAEHAEDTAEYLATKFTNFELYEWMSNILEGVYGFFLQQAMSMAKLATQQLAFERQEVPPPIIQDDYWEAPADLAVGDSTEGKPPERHGLTGSARLLQDIYKLDLYALETDKQKLQLSRTISLAQVSPVEFQRFRETGVMKFATPMEMFDRDFPGHYLRLIKRIRTSVIALIPPAQGIRATLSTAGTSRVVIKSGYVFQHIIRQYGPQSVALSSPQNATGLFELQQQSEMLLPFEGLGVDTQWEFRMPRASNLFDYSTVADVLITIDYTALDDYDYRQQVIQGLDTSMSADRAFSFRYQFADAWYDLHNPEQTPTPMVVSFQTRREDFPPNIESLKIQHVLLYFARANGQSFEVDVTNFLFTEQGIGRSAGGGSRSTDGVISTRRVNGGSWTTMIDKTPVGEWELALPDTEEMRNRFKNEEIEDILFVITYSGHTPEWPA